MEKLKEWINDNKKLVIIIAVVIVVAIIGGTVAGVVVHNNKKEENTTTTTSPQTTIETTTESSTVATTEIVKETQQESTTKETTKKQTTKSNTTKQAKKQNKTTTKANKKNANSSSNKKPADDGLTEVYLTTKQKNDLANTVWNNVRENGGLAEGCTITQIKPGKKLQHEFVIANGMPYESNRKADVQGCINVMNSYINDGYFNNVKRIEYYWIDNTDSDFLCSELHWEVWE